MPAVYYIGDAVTVMGKLPEKSVDLVLTSTPFLALRSYLPADHPDKALEIGTESTPGAFVDRLVDVVEACARILAPHGSLCIELGDTYAGSGGAGGDYNPEKWRQGQTAFAGSSKMARVRKGDIPPYPINPDNTIATSGIGWPLAKSLSLIPELFRLTLVYGFNPLTGRQTERWRARNVVRWIRPNPPVGALGDKFRPATSELMVFCKSAKRYFDLDAVREPHKHDYSTTDASKLGHTEFNRRLGVTPNRTIVADPAGAPPLDWWNIPLLEGEEETKYGKKAPKPDVKVGEQDRSMPELLNHGGHMGTHELGAPPLDWWNIPPGGFSGAHYAVWPPELCIKPIKAMSPEKVCRVCGEPSRRIVNAQRTLDGEPVEDLGAIYTGPNGMSRAPQGVGHWRLGTTRTEIGWSDCGHDDYRNGLVLDCFAGSGTTLAVATGHGRDAIGIDLDERNYELALERVGPFMLELGIFEDR